MLGQMTYANFVERYRDKSYIGSGGFAKVYKVFDFAKGHYVVLKVADVRPELKQFTLQNEVELVNQLPKHPNIVHYDGCYRFNTGIAGEMDFAILPYYEHGNLEQFLKENSLNDEEKRQIILGILYGVEFLHNQNCIHRDLKAENILIHRANGMWIPKIADFGLSRNIGNHDSAVSNSSIGMTFEYAAPEQIKNQKIYRNVDLWATGVLIFRIIADVSPFGFSKNKKQPNAKSQLEISRRIMAVELPPIFADIAAPYKTIIEKCLVLDPKSRTQNASELLQLLDDNYHPSVSEIVPPISDIQIDEVTKIIPAQDSNPSIPEAPPVSKLSTQEEMKTEIIQDRTEIIRTKANPRPQSKDNFRYTPPKEFELPKYENPNKNITQIFSSPKVSDSLPSKSQEKIIRMSDTGEGINKMWIYIPLFLLAVIAASWGLFNWLNNVPPPIPPAENLPIAKPITESTLPTDFLTCFENGKNNLRGTFELIPTAAFTSTFEAMEGACYNELCDELESVRKRNSAASRFYAKASKGENCFAPVLNASLAYHHRQIENLPSVAFFYNSGQSELSIPQKNKLDAFLKPYKRNAKKHGLLIIGRASQVGNPQGNQRLSKTRAEQIIDFVENHYIRNLKTAFVYFGAEPPQLNKSIADQYGIRQLEYKDIKYGSGRDVDFALRLNQSVLLVMYEKKIDPFDLENRKDEKK